MTKLRCCQEKLNEAVATRRDFDYTAPIPHGQRNAFKPPDAIVSQCVFVVEVMRVPVADSDDVEAMSLARRNIWNTSPPRPRCNLRPGDNVTIVSSV